MLMTKIYKVSLYVEFDSSTVFLLNKFVISAT